MIIKRMILLFMCIGIIGCSPTYHLTSKKIDKIENEAERLKDQAFAAELKADMSRIKTMDGVYVGGAAYLTHSGEQLPAEVEAVGVSLVAKNPLTLSEISQTLQTATNIPVVIAPELLDLDAKANVSRDQDESAVLTQEIARRAMLVNYQGSVSNFLRSVSSYFDVAWTFKNNQIIFTKTKIKTYPIISLPSSMTSASAVSMSGSGGGGAGSLSSSMSMTANLWQDLEKMLSDIIGKEGSFILSASLSSVTVNAPPSVLIRVEQFIENLNRELSRQVTVNISVYSVALDNSSDWDFSWDVARAVTDRLKYQIDWQSNGIFSSGVLPGISGLYKGRNQVKALFEALDRVGKVSTVTNASVTTMSGRPVPFQVSTQRGYVSNITAIVNNKDSDVRGSTVVTDTIDAGFGVILFPKVLDSGRILLQYSISMSSLAGKKDGFDEVSFNENTIQLPNIQRHSFIQESLINNGNTLVLAGFESDENSASDRGVGSPKIKVLGGAQSAKQAKRVLVILITPTVLDANVG